MFTRLTVDKMLFGKKGNIQMTDSRAEELRVLPKKLAEKLRGVVMTLRLTQNHDHVLALMFGIAHR